MPIEIPEMTEPTTASRTMTPKDVSNEYLKTATPWSGAITYEDGYSAKCHQAEIAMAEWIHTTFGGDIKLLKESKEQGAKTPDFLWRDSHWELKCATSRNSVDRAVREAAKQIQSIPGGIVLDVTDSDLSIEAIEDAINSRVRRIALDSVDVIIVSNGSLEKIFRYKK